MSKSVQSGTPRRPHVLKPNTNTQIPANIILFDTETTPTRLTDGKTRHDLKMGWACLLRYRRQSQTFSESWFYFETLDEFWKWFFKQLRKKTKTYLIAHNVIFDFTVMDGFNRIYGEGFDLKSIYEQSRTVIIRYKWNTKTILILDNMNFFKSSLAQLGKEVGLEKLDVDFKKSTLTELKTYCRRDVEIMVLTWKKYITWLITNDLGNFSVTIASQAFTSFRHRFNDDKIYIHNRQPVLDDERLAYYGGRVECFRIGEVPVDKSYILDVNSMYPYVMHDKYYPVRLKATRNGMKIIDLKNEITNNLVIANVNIKTDKPYYPKRHNNKLLFPIGEFNTYLATPEISLALSHGHITKIGVVHVYDKKKLFNNYVNFFYGEKVKAKAKGNTAETYMNKLFLNSLYGKFGQRSQTWENVDKAKPSVVSVTEIYDSVEKKWYVEYIFNGKVWVITQGGEARDSFPAIAAHVTSYARRYLCRLFDVAGWNNIYYCDTDSLFTNSTGVDNLKHTLNENELGKLGIQKVVDYLNIRGCKDYIADDIAKTKGVSKTATEISPGVYKQERWSSLKSLLREGDLSKYMVYDVTKHYAREYDKGEILETGKVIPFTFHL